MTASIKLPFGLRESQLVHISEVEGGLACRSFCPSCGQPLVAKKGRITVEHFSHSKGADCPHAVETALHLAAKRVLDEVRAITVPRLEIKFSSYKKSLVIKEERRLEIQAVQLESHAGDIRPDIIVDIANTKLAIEIFVTHRVDAQKARRFREIGLSAIEINLSGLSRDASWSDIQRSVIENHHNKRWIFSNREFQLCNLLFDAAERRRSIERGFAAHIDNCPINARVWRGRPYANVVDDCLSCRFCLAVGDNMSSVVCSGRSQIATIEQLLEYERNVRQQPLK